METELKRILMPKSRLATISVRSDGLQEFSCVECPAKYVDKEKLEVHLCTHYKEYRFLCGICGTGLKRKEHLERHTFGHQEVRPHVCPVCDKGFKRKEHMTIHLSIHNGDKNQVCPICQRSFYRKDHLQKHLQTHNKMFMEQNIYPVSDQELMEIKQELMDDDSNTMVLDSSKCDVSIEMADEYNDTEQNTSNTKINPERPFACNICDKTYKRKDHLKLHSESHLKRDKVCSECGKGFARDEQLLCHMSVHLKCYPGGGGGVGGEEAQEYDQDVSSDTMSTEHTNIQILPLETNLLVPRGNFQPGSNKQSESRPHACPVCHRRFKRKQHLKVHANVHLKLQPTIWCSLCHKGFHNNVQFEQHQCMQSEGYEYEHQYENEYENQHQYEKEHESQHELEESAQPATLDAKKENNYPSEFVEVVEDENTEYQGDRMAAGAGGGAGASESDSERNIPTPLRVYVCKYCSKPFKRKDHYKIHLHIHTGIKSFFCIECGKGFYRKDHLQKHAIVHQKDKPKSKKAIPELYPISLLNKMSDIKPEITITAPSNTKLRVPLQIKVPYQMVMSMDNGEQRAVTIDPQAVKFNPQ